MKYPTKPRRFEQRGPFTAFISYSHKDERFADVVAQVLDRYFYSFWRDKESIPPGRSWRDAIIDGVKSCEVFLVIVPRERSVRVALECGMAMGLDKPIIPMGNDMAALAEYGLDHLQALRIARYDESACAPLLKLLKDMGV